MRQLPFLVFGSLLGSGCFGGGSASGDDGGTGTGESGDTGALACDEYEDATDIGPAITIEVAHSGTDPLWFHPLGCGGALPITIRPTDGEIFGWRVPECSPVFCSEFLGAQDCTLGCNDCASPTHGRIDPAATGETSWSGVMHTPLQMSVTCAAGTDCQRECLRRDQAPAGSYTLELTAYRTCTGSCPCDGGSDGICLSWDGDAELGEPVTVSAQLDYPAQSSVMLELE